MTNKEKEFWEQWQPTARTCLCFILRGEEILLIRKKRGIGAGKINGPGGHIEPGESALESAIREVQEELGVTPCNLKERGELSFQFIDRPLSKLACADEVQGVDGAKKFEWQELLDASSTGATKQFTAEVEFGKRSNEVTGQEQQMNDDISGALHCVVFTAEGCIGEPQETEEAIPYWTHQKNIPYHEMWEDDREWLPEMLTRIFNASSAAACSQPMDTVSVLSHQLVSTPCDEEYKISELARALDVPSISDCNDEDQRSVLDEKFFNGYYFFDQDKLLSGHVVWK